MTQRILGHGARVVECAQQAERGVWARCSKEGGATSGPGRFREPEDRDHILKQGLGVHAYL